MHGDEVGGFLMSPKPLTSASVEDWFNNTTAMLPRGLKQRPRNTGTVGPNARVSYYDFLSIIYKYAVPHEFVIQVEEDEYRPNEYLVYITGKTLKPSVLESHRIKRFLLNLNRAYEEGVQPEEVVNFRNLFFITDNDTKFFHDELRTPL